MGSSLDAVEIGVIKLVVDGSTYVCSALNMSLRINEIPQATVTVGFGQGIAGGGFQDPSGLLKKVKVAKGKLPECEIYEQLELSSSVDKCLFKGVMIAAAPVYRASGSGISTAMIQVVCMHESCKLLTSPLSAYTLAAADLAVQNVVGENGSLEKIDPTLLESLDSVGLGPTVDELATQNPDIVSGISKLINKIVDQNMAKNGVAAVDCEVTKYLYSDYKVLGVNANETVENFYTAIAHLLVTSMQSGAVFDIFRGALMSAEFMLTLIPKMPGTNSKLELAPSRAWSGDIALELTEDDVLGISCSTSALETLNTPQMFVVYFQDPVKSTNPTVESTGSDSVGGVFGVHSTDNTVSEAVRNALVQDSGAATKALADMLIRCKTYRGPQWLTPFEPGTFGGVDPVDTTQDKRTQQKTEEAVTEYKKELARRGYKAARKHADDVAKALFAFIYGSHDSVQLTLNPRIRMGFNGGSIEDNVGNVVRVLITTELGGRTTIIDIKGLLTSVTYGRSSGIKSSMSYTALLTRVRDGSDDMAIDCPLYTKK